MALEIAIIGYSNTPPLQPIYVGLGVLITVVGITWLRHGANPCPNTGIQRTPWHNSRQ